MAHVEARDLLLSLQKGKIERLMSAEISEHLGHSPGEGKPVDQPNECNDASLKPVPADQSAVRIEVPRDQAGSFHPSLS